MSYTHVCRVNEVAVVCGSRLPYFPLPRREGDGSAGSSGVRTLLVGAVQSEAPYLCVQGTFQQVPPGVLCYSQVPWVSGRVVTEVVEITRTFGSLVLQVWCKVISSKGTFLLVLWNDCGALVVLVFLLFHNWFSCLTNPCSGFIAYVFRLHCPPRVCGTKRYKGREQHLLTFRLFPECRREIGFFCAPSN